MDGPLGVTFLSEAFNVSAQKVQTRVGRKKLPDTRRRKRLTKKVLGLK